MTVCIEENTAENVYILQGGQVNLTYTDIETNRVRQDVLQQGEFFGVKSARGKYQREETAAVIRDSIVVVFTIPEFEAIALKNPRIITAILLLQIKPQKERKKGWTQKPFRVFSG
jgi:CRP-like cAMP-binding protein